MPEIHDGKRRRGGLRRLLAALALTSAACGGGSTAGSPAPEPSPSAAATPGPSLVPPTASPTPAVAAGALDLAFAEGGLAIVPLGGMVGVARRGLSVAADGSMALLAFDSDDGGFTSELLRIVVSPDGRAAEIARPLSSVRALGAAFADDGSALVLGERFDGAGEVAVARLTAGGVLDASFGDGGFAATGLGWASDVVPLADGRAVVLGVRDDEPVVLRLTVDGAIDRGFGAGGVASLPPAPDPQDGGRYEPTDLAALPDGRLVVGVTFYAGIAFLPRLIAFTPAGAIDPSFGAAGIVAPQIIWPSGPLLVGRDGDVRWLVRDDILLVNAAGELRGAIPIADTTYGAGFGGPHETARGGLVLVGSSWIADEPRRFACENTSGGTCLRLAVAVQGIAADGTADAAFGDGGTVLTDLPAPYGAQDTGGRAVVAAPPGRLTVAAIACRRPFVCDLVLLRYGAP